MGQGNWTGVLQQLRRAVGAAPVVEASDRELLDRYARERDEAAFTELVRRHAALVLDVCRRLLRDPHAADDAFQVTFLVLARKAACLPWRDAVNNWLYSVACRVALKARTAQWRRQQHEQQAAISGETHADDPGGLRELLDDELSRLPASYRAPLLLCCVENKTCAEAARQLGWSAGSVKGRLERGRELLRARLARRGLALSAAALASWLAENAAAAAPPALAEAATRHALLFGAGQPVAGLISASAAQLLQATLQAYFVKSLKQAAVAALILVALAAGGGWLMHARPPQPADLDVTTERAHALAAPIIDEPPPRRLPDQQDAFGDPLPPGALARLDSPRLSCTDVVTSFDVTADGKTLALAYANLQRPQAVRQVDPGGELVYESSCLVLYRDGHFRPLPLAGTLHPVQLARDGRLVCSYRDSVFPEECGVLVWDTRSGQQVARVATGRTPVAFAPDGKSLFVVQRASIDRLELPSGKRLASFAAKVAATSMALAPDGKHLAVGEAGQVCVWDVDAGKLAHTFAVDQLKHMTFSPDSKQLATVGGDQVIRLRELATGKEIDTFTHPRGYRIYFAHFTGDGKQLIAEGPANAVWEIASHKLLAQYTVLNHETVPARLSSAGTLFSHYTSGVRAGAALTGERTALYRPNRGPSGAVLFCGGGLLSTCQNELCLRDPLSGRELRSFAEQAPGSRPELPCTLALSQDGGTLAVAAANDSGRTIQLWDTNNWKRSPHTYETDQSFALSSDGKLLVTCAGKTLRVWDTATGASPRAFALPEIHSPHQLAFLDDDRTLALVEQLPAKEVAKHTFPQGSKLTLIDFASGTVAGQRPFMEYLSALSADGKLMATCAPKALPKNARDARPLPNLGGLQKLELPRLSPDQSGFTITVSEVATGKQVRHFQNGGTPAVFSRDGKLLATLSTALYTGHLDLDEFPALERPGSKPMGRGPTQIGDQISLFIYDLATGKELNRFRLKGRPNAFAFSANGKTLAACYPDGSTIIWDVFAQLPKSATP